MTINIVIILYHKIIKNPQVQQLIATISILKINKKCYFMNIKNMSKVNTESNINNELNNTQDKKLSDYKRYLDKILFLGWKWKFDQSYRKIFYHRYI